MTIQEKWAELFKWIDSQPLYLRDFTFGLNKLYYLQEEDHFYLGGQYESEITIYLPSISRVPISIEYSSGNLRFYVKAYDAEYVHDKDFPEMAESMIAGMKTLNSEEVIAKIKARLTDEIKYKADEHEKRLKESQEAELTRLRKRVAEIEAKDA